MKIEGVAMQKELIDVLLLVEERGELKQWLTTFGQKIYLEVDFEQSPKAVSGDIAETLKRHRLLEPALWTSLAEHFSDNRFVINKISHLLGRPLLPELPRKVGRYLSSLIETNRWLALHWDRDLGTLEIELERVYIALQTEPDPDIASRLHDVEVQEAAGRSLDMIDSRQLEQLDASNIRQTHRQPSATATTSLNIAEVVRNHRRMVILGGPGSGKSTLGRWLALQFARALRQNSAEQRVLVPLGQVAPVSRDSENDALVDLGPARLPIFLRISHFAHELARCADGGLQRPSLLEYLGKDPDNQELEDGLSPTQRNLMFRHAIAEQEALLILDGLDELTERNRREVALAVQRFVLDHATAHDEPPHRVGGNQVLITSRYVGYRIAHVRAGCQHFGIQAMERSAVERFVVSWASAVNERLTASEPRLSADSLIVEIYNDDNPNLRSLATNPLLVTILATVYHTDGRLPTLRAALYDRVVNNLLNLWLRRKECEDKGLKASELLAGLEPLAAWMQGKENTNGLVSLARIRAQVAPGLAHMRGVDVNDRKFADLLDSLLLVVRQQVGLLAEQSKDNYAFAHRTFQEFLAARHLLSTPSEAADRLLQRIDDPLWHEPILLALEFALIDVSWVEESRTALLLELLKADQDAPQNIPWSTLAVVRALPSPHHTPSGVIAPLVERLVHSYRMCVHQRAARPLQHQLEDCFRRLLNIGFADEITRSVCRACKEPHNGATERAVAELMGRLEWFPSELMAIMRTARENDGSQTEWSIHRVLLVGPPPKGLQIRRSLRMRALLTNQPAVLEQINSDPHWLWLVVALYGGLSSDPTLFSWSGSEPPPPGAMPSVVAERVVWDLFDSRLSERLVRHLHRGKAAEALLPDLKRCWQRAASPQRAAEALVGLAALGEDVQPLLKDARGAVVTAVLERLRWLSWAHSFTLPWASPLAMRSIPAGLPVTKQIDLLLVVLSTHTRQTQAPLLIPGDLFPGHGLSTTQRDILDAERWAALLYGHGETFAETASQRFVLDEFLSRPFGAFLRSWSRLGCARSRGRHPLGDSMLTLADLNLPEIHRALALVDLLGGAGGVQPYVTARVFARCARHFGPEHDMLVELALAAWDAGSQCWLLFWSLLSSDGFTDAVLQQLPLDDEAREALYAGLRTGEPIASDTSLYCLVSERSPHISDPLLALRVHIRASLMRYAQKTSLKALSDLQGIERLHEAEWLLPRVPLRLLEQLDTLQETTNRTLSRSAMWLLAARGEVDWLEKAWATVPKHEDDWEQAHEIHNAYASVTFLADTVAYRDDAAAQLREPWSRYVACTWTSRMLQHAQHHTTSTALAWRWQVGESTRSHHEFTPAAPLAWGVLFFVNLTQELTDTFEAHNDAARERWDEADTAQPLRAIEQLLDSERVTVSRSEAYRLDQLMNVDPDMLDPLWENLFCPNVQELANVAHWRDQGGRAAQWLSLTEAEAGRLSPEGVDDLVELLSTANGRLLQRAGLALHGPQPHNRNPQRRWSVRRVGAETIERIGQAGEDSQCTPVNGCVLWLAHHDIVHDDDEAMRDWVERGRHVEGTGDGLLWIVQCIESITDETYQVLVNSLPESSPEWQEGVIRGVSCLFYSNRNITHTHTLLLQNALQKVPRSVRSKFSQIPAGSRAILQVLFEHTEHGGTVKDIEHLHMRLEEHQVWLDDTSLNSPLTMRRRLWELGRETYIIDSRLTNAVEIATKIDNQEQAMEILLAWTQMEWEYGEKLTNQQRNNFLLAIEAMDSASPKLFALVAQPTVWEPILSETALYCTDWGCRASSLRLLGRLRHLTTNALLAVCGGLEDIAEVQKAALQATREFRRLGGLDFGTLLEKLEDSNPTVIASVARLLVNVAREQASAEERRQILSGLQARAQSPVGRRHIYQTIVRDSVTRIESLGRIDDTLYRAVFELSGL